MSERQRLLADRFERANDALIAAAGRCTDAQWRALCRAEGWSVAVTAHHVADAYPLLWGLTQGLALGEPLPPVTLEMNQQYTAQHAAQHAACGKGETIDLLRHNGDAIARAIRELRDEQLDRSSPWTFGGGEVISVQRMIERYIIDHIGEHLASINAAIED